jgi:hypothetical protein
MKPQASEVYSYTVADPRTHHRNARGPAISFPLKLHQMLAKAEQCGYQDIVSWLPGGKAFKIHNPEGIVSILKTHFNQTKYKSFVRQLQNYGFHRFTRGPRKGVCTHKLLVQWDPFLCLQIKRPHKANPVQLNPIVSSMVQTSSAGSLGKEKCEPKMRLHPADMKNESFQANTMNSSKNVNTTKRISHEHDILLQDDSWLNKLLIHQDLWMTHSSSNSNEDATIENMFEPNHIIFPETS